ncbi:hypothetical protein [Pedobacter gandavensis]|uniref:hypothetical protein n=1 Tax=Pedobacter gandavensis TaxID=2679963 RepID=UPI00292F1B17|nr:hypothetical protein [Pedobacter gandavensis]
MANPLTLYVPIKQDGFSQAAAQLAYSTFVSSVQAGLDKSGIVHYARVALIPNANSEGINAILLITTFDGPMNPYLEFFWKNPSTQAAFAGIAKIALDPPSPPVTDLTGFQNFINNNNLNNTPPSGAKSALYQAYPQTVEDITDSFPPETILPQSH